MKRIILTIFLAAMFAGCLPEYREGCPDKLRLFFELEDEFETGTYDTRVAADVMLAVFNDRYFVRTIRISYPEIAGGKEYVIKKDESLAGNVEMVAWAASTIEGYDPSGIPGQQGDLSDLYLGLEPITRADGDYYYPAQCGLYMGIASVTEKVDEPSEYTIGMIHSTCRVEVYVTDGSGVLGSGGSEAAVAVHGSMNRMDMNMRGAGAEAVVRTRLGNDKAEPTSFATGRFGIMPSAEGQTLSVEILNDTETLAVLTVPNSALPTGAKAGSLIIFEYIIGDAEFWVTVNGFKRKVVMLDV